MMTRAICGHRGRFTNRPYGFRPTTYRLEGHGPPEYASVCDRAHVKANVGTRNRTIGTFHPMGDPHTHNPM
jgi:hypothetical protein